MKWNSCVLIVYWFNPFRSRQRPFRLLIHSSLNMHDQSSRTLLTRKETNDNERRDFHMPLSQHCWAWVWKLWIVTYYPVVSHNGNGNMYTPKSKYSRTFWDKRVVRLLRWLSVNRKENNIIVSRNWWTSCKEKYFRVCRILEWKKLPIKKSSFLFLPPLLFVFSCSCHNLSQQYMSTAKIKRSSPSRSECLWWWWWWRCKEDGWYYHHLYRILIMASRC